MSSLVGSLPKEFRIASSGVHELHETFPSLPGRVCGTKGFPFLPNNITPEPRPPSLVLIFTIPVASPSPTDVGSKSSCGTKDNPFCLKVSAAAI